MKSIAIKVNPAFKRTQPLPVLSADFKTRAGWAARSIAQVAGTLPAVAVRAAGAVVKPGLNMRLAAAMG